LVYFKNSTFHISFVEITVLSVSHIPLTGSNRQKTLQPLLKNIQLQLISAQDLMKIVVPSGLFSSDKVMEALAYQADPTAFDS